MFTKNEILYNLHMAVIDKLRYPLAYDHNASVILEKCLNKAITSPDKWTVRGIDSPFYSSGWFLVYVFAEELPEHLSRDYIATHLDGRNDGTGLPSEFDCDPEYTDTIKDRYALAVQPNTFPGYTLAIAFFCSQMPPDDIEWDLQDLPPLEESSGT